MAADVKHDIDIDETESLSELGYAMKMSGGKGTLLSPFLLLCLSLGARSTSFNLVETVRPSRLELTLLLHMLVVLLVGVDVLVLEGSSSSSSILLFSFGIGAARSQWFRGVFSDKY